MHYGIISGTHKYYSPLICHDINVFPFIYGINKYYVDYQYISSICYYYNNFTSLKLHLSLLFNFHPSAHAGSLPHPRPKVIETNRNYGI